MGQVLNYTFIGVEEESQGRKSSLLQVAGSSFCLELPVVYS